MKKRLFTKKIYRRLFVLNNKGLWHNRLKYTVRKSLCKIEQEA